jgi:hypothetical protein
MIITPEADSLFEKCYDIKKTPLGSLLYHDPNNQTYIMNYLNVDKKTQPYVHATYLFNYKCKDFFKELYDIEMNIINKFDNIQLENHDETLLNVLLWKYESTKYVNPYVPYYEDFIDNYINNLNTDVIKRSIEVKPNNAISNNVEKIDYYICHACKDVTKSIEIMSMIRKKHKKKPKVILSTDQNLDYLFYAPITCYVWEYFGFKPVLMVLGKSEYSDLVYRYVKKYSNAEIIEIDSIPLYRDSTIVQFSRLYASCFEKNDDQYLLTGDIDMLALNSYLYRDFDKKNIFGPDLTNYYHYPICYIGMKVNDWKSLLNLEYGKFNENIIRDLSIEKLSKNDKFDDYWYTDQRFITNKINEYGIDKFNIIERGFENGNAAKRLDKLDWNFQSDKDYIDCHLFRNGWEKDNFNKTIDVIDSKIHKNNDWIVEYWNEFIKIINNYGTSTTN